MNWNLWTERVQENEIRASVESAFANRLIIDTYHITESASQVIPEVRYVHTSNDIEGANKVKTLIAKESDQNEVIKIPFIPELCEAYVDDVRDYPVLLCFAIETVFKHANQQIPDDRRRALLKKDLAHEFQHASQGWKVPGLKIKYAVRFTEDADGSSIGWHPRIILTGSATRQIIRNILSATKWRSKGDEVALS